MDYRNSLWNLEIEEIKGILIPRKDARKAQPNIFRLALSLLYP